MLGIGDPVTEQLKLTSTPAAGKTILDGTMRKVGGPSGTKIQQVKYVMCISIMMHRCIITPTIPLILVH